MIPYTLLMKMPSPRDMGLPEKFDSWRTNQETTLNFLINNRSVRVKCPMVPTGGGKSAINVAYALMTKEPTVIVTATKGLQDQYNDDFGSIGMVDIRGKSNYPCTFRDDWNCQEGAIAKCPYMGTINCPYSQQTMRASSANLIVTNYAKWTTSGKLLTSCFSHIKQVIFDEGHHCPDAIADEVQVVLNHHEISELLGLNFPAFPDCGDFMVWRKWALIAKSAANDELAATLERIKTHPKKSLMRHADHMQRLVRRLSIVATANPVNWIVEELPNGFQFDPVDTSKYCESVLLLQKESVIITAATVREKTLKIIGVKREQYAYLEVDSDFDPADSPIYYVPTTRVDQKNHDLSMLWIRFDQIAGRRRDRKGLVHTISYNRRDELTSRSRYSEFMLVNEQGEPTNKMVDYFKYDCPPGTIFVSPIIGTGYDFPGTSCEWNFLMKIPFEPPSKIKKARQEHDSEYASHRAAQYMEQAFGRGTRYKGDRCENFCCDDNLVWFWRKNAHLFSKNYRRRFKTVYQPPNPLPKLPED